MRIAYEASAIQGNRTGVEYYALRLFEALSALDGVEVVALSDHPVPEIPGAIVQKFSLPRSLWWCWALPRVLRRTGCRTLHVPVTAIPPFSPVPVIATVHDLGWATVPDCHRRRDILTQRFWFHVACRRAARILCVSDATRRDVVSLAPRAAGKARTVLSGAIAADLVPADEAAVRRTLETFHIPPRFILCVGRVERRKNPAQVLRAFAQATRPADLADVAIVFAGSPGNEMNDAVAAARQLGISGRVIFCSYVCDGLSALYQAATALVYASRYEGFGHPPFEAISLGTPVIASDIPSTRETLGPGGLLVPVDDTAALATAIQRVLREPAFRDELLVRGRERLCAFSWRRTAEQVATLHREIAG